jgi:hypothetical protein
MAKTRIARGIPIHGASVIAVLLTLAVAPTSATAAPKECRGAALRSGSCTISGQNQPPTISGTPPAVATTGEPYAFTPAASDPEGRTLSFSIANKPPWATFSASTGRLAGTPTAADEGEHADILIQVSDGRLTASLPRFFVVVSTGNQAPNIAGTPPTVAREGQAYEFKPTAADADGDPLTFTIANRPAWATFDPQTGRLAGTPGAGSVGTYRDITIRVSDGTVVSALPAYSIAVEQASLGSATLSWVAPTQRDDGSPLTNLAGYRVRYGTSPGSYPNQLQIPNPGITSCVIENLPAGTYYFVATAYDSDGRESEYSGVVTKTIG